MQRAAEHCSPEAAQLSYALLFRGEAYRYGCNEHGTRVQDNIMRSHHEMVTRSLEACGSTVDILLAIDTRGCANSSLRARLASWHEDHVRIAKPVVAHTQPQNIRASLNMFLPYALRYDMLIVTRYDLYLRQPFRQWPGCQDPTRIGIASRCERNQWFQWNCSNDVLFVVPREHLWAFNASVGSSLAACFASSGESVSRSVPKGLGHGCYNSLASRVGAEQLSFCWPILPRGSVTMQNDYYQCCKHGMHGLGSITNSMVAQQHLHLIDAPARVGGSGSE
jgi:hypothetical protein